MQTSTYFLCRIFVTTVVTPRAKRIHTVAKSGAPYLEHVQEGGAGTRSASCPKSRHFCPRILSRDEPLLFQLHHDICQSGLSYCQSDHESIVYHKSTQIYPTLKLGYRIESLLLQIIMVCVVRLEEKPFQSIFRNNYMVHGRSKLRTKNKGCLLLGGHKGIRRNQVCMYVIPYGWNSYAATRPDTHTYIPTNSYQPTLTRYVAPPEHITPGGTAGYRCWMSPFKNSLSRGKGLQQTRHITSPVTRSRKTGPYIQ